MFRLNLFRTANGNFTSLIRFNSKLSFNKKVLKPKFNDPNCTYKDHNCIFTITFLFAISNLSKHTHTYTHTSTLPQVNLTPNETQTQREHLTKNAKNIK